MESANQTESLTVKRKIPSLGFRPRSKNHKRTISISLVMDSVVQHYLRRLHTAGLDMNYSQFVRALLEHELEGKFLLNAQEKFALREYDGKETQTQRLLDPSPT